MSIARCPHCGTANRAGSNFCNGCGTDLRESEARRSVRPSRRRAAEQPPPIAPPTPPTDVSAQAETPRARPWLRLDFEGEGQPPPPAGTDDPTAPPEAESTRLISGVQGLLTPIRVTTTLADDDPAPAPVAPPPAPGLAAEELRLLRGALTEPPNLTAYTPHPHPRPPRNLRSPWLFAMLALLVGVPALLRVDNPAAAPARLPGVTEAHAAIQSLAPETPVIVYWAYDPAGAGELDLIMQPVMRHLLQRRTRPAVISPLPGGPATAQRLLTRVRGGLRPADLVLAASLAQPVTYTYLPGGAAVLPLIVHAPTLAGAPEEPGLVVVAAAQAEEVQHWLEQVQPFRPVPVVAVTAAGADPILRPYRDSGQLVGLVSGFDGGYAYQRLLDPFATPDGYPTLTRHLALQNWGQAALLAAIVLGNLAALVGRAPDA